MTATYDRSIFDTPKIRVEGLDAYQYRGGNYLMCARRSINAAPRGAGKSIITLAALDALEAFPAIIVSTASTKLKWAGEIVSWFGHGRKITVLDGKTVKPFEGVYFDAWARGRGDFKVPVNDLSADIIIVNYNILWDWCLRLGELTYRALVMDEAHKIKDEKSHQHNACQYLADRVELLKRDQCVYALTADTIVNQVDDLQGILKVIGRIHEFGGKWGFRKRFCDLKLKRKVTKRGHEMWFKDFSGSSNESDLHRELKARCMFRITKQEAMPDLPPKKRVIVPIELSNREEYDRAEADLIPYIREVALADERYHKRLMEMGNASLRALVADDFLSGIEHLPVEEQDGLMRRELKEKYANSAVRKALKAPGLARVRVLRQLTSAGKIRGELEWFKDFREENPTSKLILFAHHKKIQDDLKSGLPKAAALRGGDSAVVKNQNVLRFEREPDCTEIVVSSEAGSEGNDMTAAHDTAICELPWTPKTLLQAEDRAYGRKNDPHSITSWIFVGIKSLDGHILSILERKLEVASKVQDGRVMDKLISDDVEDELFDLIVDSYAA